MATRAIGRCPFEDIIEVAFGAGYIDVGAG